MSVVSTVLLTCWLGEEVDDDGTTPAIAYVNRYLEDHQYGNGLRDLGPRFGGYKAPQMLVYGGAFNYLDHDEFLTVVRAAPWDTPESVQVYICGEWDKSFTEHRVVPASPAPAPPGEGA